jgi:hypothetical protein
MSDVFYLRPIDPPIEPEDVQAMAQHAGGCFGLHRVDWRQSFLAADGGRMLCWYRAPDAESARLALRQLGSDMSAVWAGRVIADGPENPAVSQARAVAEILLDESLADADLAQRTAALQRQDIALVCAFLSTRGDRLACLFRSSDPRAIEAALDDAGLPANAVWTCVPVTPVLGA